MTTIEEINCLMEALDDEKERISDGEYLTRANNLRDMYQKVKGIKSNDDYYDSDDDDFNDSAEILLNYFMQTVTYPDHVRIVFVTY